MSQEPAMSTSERQLTEALAMLERVRTQLARAARRSDRLDSGRLDWLARQVAEAAALVRAACEEES